MGRRVITRNIIFSRLQNFKFNRDKYWYRQHYKVEIFLHRSNLHISINIETVQQIFVQGFGIYEQRKFASTKCVTFVKLFTKEKEICQKMKYRISKWRKGQPCYDIYVRPSASERGVDVARVTKPIWKPTNQKSRFIYRQENVYQKNGHICSRKAGVTIPYLRLIIGPVPSQMRTALLMQFIH
jgi:hypothetical protein